MQEVLEQQRKERKEKLKRDKEQGKKKIKPEKVNTNPSMDGQEQSKRPILVRER